MYVRVRVRHGLMARGQQVHCRQELQRALKAAERQVDWAVFLLEETGPHAPGYRCTLSVGRRGASVRSVEAREEEPDAAVRRAVERVIAVLAHEATAAPVPEEGPVAEVVPLPRPPLPARGAAGRGAPERRSGPTARGARGG